MFVGKPGPARSHMGLKLITNWCKRDCHEYTEAVSIESNLNYKKSHPILNSCITEQVP